MNITNIPASLDFPPGRVTVAVHEIAAKLSCTSAHVISLVEEGAMQALDIKGSGVSRSAWRVPIESYRKFIAARLR